MALLGYGELHIRQFVQKTLYCRKYNRNKDRPGVHCLNTCRCFTRRCFTPGATFAARQTQLQNQVYAADSRRRICLLGLPETRVSGLGCVITDSVICTRRQKETACLSGRSKPGKSNRAIDICFCPFSFRVIFVRSPVCLGSIRMHEVKQLLQSYNPNSLALNVSSVLIRHCRIIGLYHDFFIQ